MVRACGRLRRRGCFAWLLGLLAFGVLVVWLGTQLVH